MSPRQVTLARREQERGFDESESLSATSLQTTRADFEESAILRRARFPLLREVCQRQERNFNESEISRRARFRVERDSPKFKKFADDESATTRVRLQVCRQQSNTFIRFFLAITDTPYFKSFDEFEKILQEVISWSDISLQEKLEHEVDSSRLQELEFLLPSRVYPVLAYPRDAVFSRA